MAVQLNYGALLSTQEIESRYRGAEQEFARVQKNYSGVFGRFKMHLSESDKRTLGDLVGVLLLLSTQPVVQDGASKVANACTVGTLNMRILDYASRFRNSGVDKIRREVSA
ncbi:MAG: hypothetical protein HY832_02720 [Candidatus Aenigmarchaeota archaeon]|nr:hypothetical protein [Candidatus Aenigmarchaeota archaeon]